MKPKYILLLAASFLMFACNNNPTTEEKDELAAEQDSFATTGPEISEEVMNDLIQSLPSPIEMSTSIKESGAEFDTKKLNPSENSDGYTTNYKKAVNLGIYGADLGYINIYEKTYYALNYLNVIKRLADDLKVGHFFDFNTLKRLSSNNTNIDSLLYISTTSFNNMDAYLRKQKRGNLSVLIVCGTWLEGLHIATEVVKDKKHEMLYEKIGEQKIVMDNLLLILQAHKNDPFFADLYTDFQNIKKEYDKISITYVYKEPESKEVNGQLVIVDNSTTTVNIAEKNVQEISAAVHKVREKLTGPGAN
jgi:hypothetical protein